MNLPCQGHRSQSNSQPYYRQVSNNACRCTPNFCGISLGTNFDNWSHLKKKLNNGHKMRISVWLSFMKNSQCLCTDVKKKIHMCPTSLISQVLAFNKTNPDSVNLVCQEGCALMNSVNCLHCIISMLHMKSYSACLLGVLLNSKCHSAGAPLRCNRNGTIM